MERIDLIISCLAHQIKDHERVLTGVASPLPMLAIQLAKRLWAPNLTYFNCIGAVDPASPPFFPHSSVSVSVLKEKKSFLELPFIWDLAQRKMIDLMFFSAVQIDRQANINLTSIGDYKKPKVKLPGPAGSISMRSLCRKAIVFTLKHNLRTFVPKVDFITTGSQQETLVITNLGILILSPNNARIVSVHPGVSKEEVTQKSGFPIEIDQNIAETPLPSQKELEIINQFDPQGERYKLLQGGG